MKRRAKAVGGTRGKEIRGRVTDVVTELLEWCEVVEDPKAASVGADDEIFEVILHQDPMDRRMRQIVLQRLPRVAIIERNIERVLGPGVKQPFSNGVFLDRIGVAHRRFGNAGDDELPSLAEVGGLI